ncbi:hypothetical protein B0T18DRAFT_430826 [Schizothecium vesticola]|uniref:DNA mismatch repair protein PMS1 n=1 Tax=Schizothecium vesticola TaxID=314040 RepID=A0AA40EQE0_9PEZI|nr:hypothetical protein B0T18DRAFT_430826 [Schizothecium vesticola]
MESSATIKAIESSTVHQIQSGQVIVDLCSVAKELVENSIDAGATIVDVRFKNQGLDSIEVQDNGSGISSQNYASIALKHYTSKLSTYDDLSTLQTFGFRGEALSSLSALSHFSIVTCTAREAPRANKLEFEISGKLKGTSVVSGQRGTTVFVEDLFYCLPVRRRELERNIKREWTKVIGLLNQYACIQTGVKFTVSQQPTKGKRMVLFSTKGNPTTRDNIINVFGVKTMSALIALHLKLELKPTAGPTRKGKAVDDGTPPTEVRVLGHVSRPTHGEGRQTPDRQMFYVNGRPCGLPQFAKVFNEVYRSYNSSQSPFIFADIQLDTHLYDVNVSPDKRTILLHDQGQMLDNLRESLIELFETQDVTIPVAAQQHSQKLLSKKAAPIRLGAPATSTPVSRLPDPPSQSKDEQSPAASEDEGSSDEDDGTGEMVVVIPRKASKRPRRRAPTSSDVQTAFLLSRWLDKKSDPRVRSVLSGPVSRTKSAHESPEADEPGKDDKIERNPETSKLDTPNTKNPEDEAMSEEENGPSEEDLLLSGEYEDEMSVEMEETPIAALPPPSQPPVPRSKTISPMKPPNRSTQEVATITIGGHAVMSILGSPSKRSQVEAARDAGNPPIPGKERTRPVALPTFGGRLSQMFSASASTQDEGASRLDVTMENVEMPLEDEEDENEEELEDEDDGDDSLFVKQSEEHHAMSEEERPSPESDAPQSVQSDESPQEEADLPVIPPSPRDVAEPPSPSDEQADSDGEYLDEDDKKAREEQKVQDMIKAAEAKAATETTQDSEKRSQMLLKGGARRKDATINLVQRVHTSHASLQKRITAWEQSLPTPTPKSPTGRASEGLESPDAEEKLSLKITKSDFATMRIVGQFNLGFILAVRNATNSDDDDELFIIDQHASDEKYNFERLQATTTIQSQRLVQPKALELTAVDEELVMEHAAALERNGFVVAVDTSGDRPVGARCQLLSLPVSRETTFSVADLEELVYLLGENPSGSATTVPRPSKVRKMLAMRACRSSIMIGRALGRRQMERVVRHMGEMEKPWNCPHGRPTMRHLCGLGGAWDGRVWREEEGFGGEGRADWAGWMRDRR